MRINKQGFTFFIVLDVGSKTTLISYVACWKNQSSLLVKHPTEVKKNVKIYEYYYLSIQATDGGYVREPRWKGKVIKVSL